MLLAAVALIFLTSLLIMYYIFVLFFLKERVINRIDDPVEKNVIQQDKKKNSKANKTILSEVATKVPKFRGKRRKEIKLLLSRANLKMTVEELLIYKILSSFIVAFLLFTIRQDYFLSIISCLIIWQIPNFIIKNRVKKRLNDFNDQLNSGIILISNALKAGYSFMQAVSVAAKETQGTFSDEFKILLKEMNFGIPLDIAMSNLLSRVDSKDMRLIVNAILIQKDIGGNLSEILENISETIRERQKIKNEMKTLTAQGKMSGMIVMFMPVFLGGVIYLFNKEYIMLLFQTKLGLAMIAVSVVNEIIGATVIRKIINIDM